MTKNKFFDISKWIWVKKAENNESIGLSRGSSVEVLNYSDEFGYLCRYTSGRIEKSGGTHCSDGELVLLDKEMYRSLAPFDTIQKEIIASEMRRANFLRESIKLRKRHESNI